MLLHIKMSLDNITNITIYEFIEYFSNYYKITPNYLYPEPSSYRNVRFTLIPISQCRTDNINIEPVLLIISDIKWH